MKEAGLNGVIETVSANSLDDILPLIRQYQAFYGVEDSCDERNRRFFSRFGNDSEAGCQFLYREGGEVLGFATLYFSYASTIAAKVAVLNDLYTVENARGRGIARALLKYCQYYAAAHEAARLQWLTAPDNVPAQRLYDSLDANKSEWLFYSTPLSDDL